MPKICTVMSAAAEVVIRTRDHCEPHVHGINKKWEIKVFFSYADNDPCHLAVKVLKGAPPIAHINDVIDEVDLRLAQCRKRWWEIHKSTCLENQNVTVSPAGLLTWVVPPAGVKVSKAVYSHIHNSVTFVGLAGGAAQTAKCP